MFKCKNCGEDTYDYEKEEKGIHVCDECLAENPCTHQRGTVGKKEGEFEGKRINRNFCLDCDRDLGLTIAIGYTTYDYDPAKADEFRTKIVEQEAWDKKHYEEYKDDPILGDVVRKRLHRFEEKEQSTVNSDSASQTVLEPALEEIPYVTRLFSISEPKHILHFRALLTTVSKFTPGKRKFVFDSTGLSFEAMDQGSIFTNFVIKRDFFKDYPVFADKQSFEFWCVLEDLEKVLATTEKNPGEVIFEFMNEKTFTVSVGPDLKCSIALKQPEDDEEKRNIAEIIRSIPLYCKIDFRPGLLNDLFSNLMVAKTSGYYGHLVITTKQVDSKPVSTSLSIQVEQDSVSVLQTIPAFESNLTVDDGKETIVSSYDFNELVKYDKSKFEQIVPLARTSSIEYGEDKPIRINLFLSEHADFTFVMAPLVEDDDSYDDKEDD